MQQKQKPTRWDRRGEKRPTQVKGYLFKGVSCQHSFAFFRLLLLLKPDDYYTTLWARRCVSKSGLIFPTSFPFFKCIIFFFFYLQSGFFFAAVGVPLKKTNDARQFSRAKNGFTSKSVFVSFSIF
jgi:hypothetical protein